MNVGIAVSRMPVEYSETLALEDAAKLLLSLAVSAVLGGLRVPIGPQDFERMLSDPARRPWKLMQTMSSLENTSLRVTVQRDIPQLLLRPVEYRESRDLGYSISQLSTSTFCRTLLTAAPHLSVGKAFHLILIAFL